MAEEQFQERTEKATPRRRQKAREEGRVARSQELNSAVMLCLGALTLYFVGPLLIDQLERFMVFSFAEAPNMQVTTDSLVAFFSSKILTFFAMMGPVMIILALTAYGVNVLQVGILFTGKPIEPKLDKLNFANGIKRLFSTRSLFILVRDVIKLALIAFVGYKVVVSQLDTFYMLSDNSVPVFAGTMGKIALTTTLKIGAVILILALFDYAFQKYDYEKNIRMSKQDIRDESKDTDGSPETKMRIRRMQREMSRKRMMQEIPDADVVITNPTHLAVALKYKPDYMDAPMVIAKGQRLVAQRIKEIAKDAGVPIVENKPLARALFELCDVGSYVPAKLYRAVAEVLAYVYRLQEAKV
ncbi:MAG: flagellar biosynthesis protein FlhB [candidate division Zixibacteria bacterium]|nr:flagellar biosynthesis protein FlhB [candidate division Zixibacteria bacterium]